MLSKLQLTMLCDAYGPLLTKKQADAVRMYCDCDCSLSEIGSEEGVSRQAVRYQILSAEKALLKYEENLKILSDRRKLQNELFALREKLEHDEITEAKRLLSGLLEENGGIQ